MPALVALTGAFLSLLGEAALRESNLAVARDRITEQASFCLVMELLDGVDFETLVDEHAPEPPARVVQLLLQVCNSLAEAHDAGLVHRDSKPAKLFVCRVADEVDVVKVLDFGLVRSAFDDGLERAALPLAPSLPGLTRAEGLIGTPAFMAPEQIRGCTLDGRADLYALGGVAYWLLTGCFVFELDDAVELVLAHAREPLPDLRASLPREVPDMLVQLIATCMAKRPEDRPPDARALARALRAIQFAQAQAWSEEEAQRWWAAPPIPGSSLPPEGAPQELAVGVSTAVARRG